MNFNTYFKLTSYAVVACGALTLLISDGISLLIAVIYATALIAAWYFENSRWQISEKLGLIFIVLALPLFYLDWQMMAAIMPRERAGAATLAHLILALSIVKLLQIKADRDWVFLYLISFFEVLLAAGLSISPLFLAALILYLLFAVCTIVAFEIQKSERQVKIVRSELHESNKKKTTWRLPIAATSILLLIMIFAVPLFFIMPRVGGAGMGNGGGGGGGASNFVGFSEKVALGAIGRLQQSDQVVMRVRIEDGGALALKDLRWRGVALDNFDNLNWRRTNQNNRQTESADEKGLVKFGMAGKAEDLTVQTFYVEPLETPVLFGIKRIIAVQSNFAALNTDSENSVFLPKMYAERNVYKVYSDTSQPDEQVLRNDNAAYSAASKRYLQLPEKYDNRIAELAQKVVQNAGARNRYEAASAIESFLQNDFGYTLDLKASGPEPLADFLFNWREGHCELFSTAMAVMLRTQGIATRVVNGFQAGEYNDAADAFIVSQKEAHSWVEVYFPESNAWVTFDPTPAAGRDLSAQANAEHGFIAAQVNKYLEAAQMFWLQYVVAFDNQEQRNLVRNLRDQFLQNQAKATEIGESWTAQISRWWSELSGKRGAAARFSAVLQIVLVLGALAVLIVLVWLLKKQRVFRRLFRFFRIKPETDMARIVEFYERMTEALARRGWRRAASQTPLEFANSVGAREALLITEAYNRVRFGEKRLTESESADIEIWLHQLEAR